MTARPQPGQGHEDHVRPATLAAASAFPIEKITWWHGDTDKVQFGMGHTAPHARGAPPHPGQAMSAYYPSTTRDREAKESGRLRAGGCPSHRDFKGRIFYEHGHPTRRSTFHEAGRAATSPTSSTGAQWMPGLKEAPRVFDPTPTFTSRRGAYLRGRASIRDRLPTASMRWTAVGRLRHLINPMIVEGKVSRQVLPRRVGQAMLEGPFAGRPAAAGQIHGLASARWRTDFTTWRCIWYALPVESLGNTRAAARGWPRRPRRRHHNDITEPWATRVYRHAGDAARSVARARAQESPTKMAARPSRRRPVRRSNIIARNRSADAAKLREGSSAPASCWQAANMIPNIEAEPRNPRALDRIWPASRADGIDKEGQRHRIGAMTTNERGHLANSPVVCRARPSRAFARVAGAIGDTMYARNRGHHPAARFR